MKKIQTHATTHHNLIPQIVGKVWGLSIKDPRNSSPKPSSIIHEAKLLWGCWWMRWARDTHLSFEPAALKPLRRWWRLRYRLFFADGPLASIDGGQEKNLKWKTAICCMKWLASKTFYVLQIMYNCPKPNKNGFAVPHLYSTIQKLVDSDFKDKTCRQLYVGKQKSKKLVNSNFNDSFSMLVSSCLSFFKSHRHIGLSSKSDITMEFLLDLVEMNQLCRLIQMTWAGRLIWSQFWHRLTLDLRSWLAKKITNCSYL